MRNQLESLISEKTKANIMLKAFSISKVPLLFITGAKVKNISDTSCNIYMPFNRLVKNHLGSLYFGALAIGADACIGLLASHKIYNSKNNISLVFKSFDAEFLKRAMGPTQFICNQGEQIDQMIKQTLESGERVTQIIDAHAETQGEIVAQFKLGLSLKLKK